ncbi:MULTISPECIES: [protein-PII] uridylyltransferase [unclassified Paracoccus (in: a-proteobacteria)]|uniref:[protein-PII] uridylyltransferase n=1 Tax=unclassified Paracoccus (in: a-proteobacteria) TaxID=2688777 RepID=UPI001602C307|nr:MULTISPECIES: [protein-PII] uridylyltransferase [unclassified Paracoccus (in: a-proteobacteria)]MBB1490353.1 [protein-PII] uridylyltransferase [Paracoccus sp. MC1854]MBB1497195.1 [protein-PII] uridylyltransferase [Paracoccus sp. MC1862]QQO44829.1 [protein-PII] uridylyltransferase [Paracoccus sp. MC1862]
MIRSAEDGAAVQPIQSAPALPGAHPLFDSESAIIGLDAALQGLTDPREIRARTVALLSTARAEAMADIVAGLASHPRKGRETVRAIAQLTDATVRAIHHVATVRLHPNLAPTEGERLAVLAVGGYGRGEMAPHSDVDLLFLLPWKPTGWIESVIESMLYMLWDLKLKVGQATRSIDECIRLAEADMTIRTSLLEHRLVCGDALLGQTLRERLWPELFERTVPQFIEAKLEERKERHRRQGGRRYVLEPNVKEGKGGLRDLQTLYWIAKYIHQVDRAIELVDAGHFTRAEHTTFWAAEDFLWAVRCHMHLVAGRAVEKLSFDMQVEVAGRMGYRDAGGRRGVEIFMQDYFRQATRVGELTRVFLTGLEQRHLYRATLLERFRKPRVAAGFRVETGRLAIADPDSFFADPLNILRVFEEALRSGILIHPEAMRLVAQNLYRIDEPMRADPEAARIFLDLLLKHGNPERALRRMNELGVLGAYIPEFERIVAMMQFNVYHHYTVDEHLIQCVAALAQIERGELVEDLPIVSAVMAEGKLDRTVIYLATLLHDIGKGRPEDHSIIGAQIARRVCQRLGLDPARIELVEWLIRNHLLMSDVAQKRDISDPRTLRDFAKAVRSRQRLDLLAVLTVCDIRGVGPTTWNNWKAELLRKLHRLTADVLENGLEDVNREQRVDEARRSLRHLLTAQGWAPADIRAEVRRHYDSYWQGLPTDTQQVFARLLKGISADEIRMDLDPDLRRDATRAAFVMADHPGLFSRLAGALALVGANVVDARTYTTRDGYATAVFWVQDAEGRPYASDRLPQLKRMIFRTLAGEVVPRDALTERDKPKKRDRAFRFPTHVTFDNEGSEIHTIIQVDTRDRPGLLYDLTRTLAANHIQIVSAVIATYGAQVVDSFYVKDAFGLKLTQPAKREALERRLHQAIREGAERAEA